MDQYHVSIPRIACGLAIFSALLSSTAPSPLYPIYVAQMGLSQLVGTAIFAIYAFGTLIALALSGRFGRSSFDPLRLLLPALIVTLCGSVIFALANGPAMLLVGRFLNGFGTGAITGTATAALYALDAFQGRRVAAIISTLSFTCGAALGPILSSSLIAMDIAPTVTPFFCIIVINLIAFAILILSPWPITKTGLPDFSPAEATENAPSSARPRLLLLACVTIAAAWTMGSVWMAVGTSFARNLFDLPSAALAGTVPAVFQLFAGIGQASFGQARTVFSIKLGCAGLIGVQAALIVLSFSPSVPLLFVMIALCGVFYGAAFVGATGLVHEAAPADQREIYVARYFMTGYLSNAASTLIIGATLDLFSFSGAFYVFSALLGVIAAYGVILAGSVAEIG